MWPMATVLYSAVPNGPRVLSFWFYFVIFFSQSQHPFFATVVVYVAISLSLNFLDLSLQDIIKFMEFSSKKANSLRTWDLPFTSL